MALSYIAGSPMAPALLPPMAAPAIANLPVAAMPSLLGLPDAYSIARTGGQLAPLPPIASPLAHLPLIGSLLSWTAPVLESVGTWTNRLIDPIVNWSNRLTLQPIKINPLSPKSGWQQAPSPDWRVGGTIISQLAETYGHQRGQPIHDPRVIRAMLDKAGQLYGVPGEYLARVAELESSGQHFDKQGRVVAGAAVGIMQVEKSAYPALMAGGPANALHNAYDMGNNMAIGAQQIRQSLDRQIQLAGYHGNDPWHDLGPLLDIAYNAGSGALEKAEQIARQRGLDPFNWQHLLLGRTLSTGLWGRLDIKPQDMANSPIAQATKYYHDRYAAQGHGNLYPIAWHSPDMVKAFDFDGNGVATKNELLLARTLYLVTGKRYRA